jgi:hypothetical protein
LPELTLLVFVALICRAYEQEVLEAAGGSDEKQLTCVHTGTQLYARVGPELLVLVCAAPCIAGHLSKSFWSQQVAVTRSS